MRKYDHLFFDLDNTLWDFTTNSRLALKQTLVQNGIIEKLKSFDSYFETYEQINKSLWHDYHQKKVTKQVLIAERFSQSFNSFGISGYNWHEINSQYLANMALQTRLFPETLETLQRLKEKGYRMYIITNGFKEVQRAKLDNCELSQFFSNVFISEEIQTTKPHREIFEHALKSTNASKKKSIMIGDSWDTDIVGALEFGIDQVMFLNNGQNEVPDPIKSKFLNFNTQFLNLAHRTKTWFINEIANLTAIL